MQLENESHLKWWDAFKKFAQFGKSTRIRNIHNGFFIMNINNMIIALYEKMLKCIEFTLKQRIFSKLVEIKSIFQNEHLPRAARLSTYLSISLVFSGCVACIETSLAVL